MDIEKLIEDVIESDKNETQFFELLLDHWVYFYFHKTNGKDTKPGKGNVDVVILTGKDNPVNLPMIENELGRNGVIYTNLDLAVRLAEFDCKIGKIRGLNAIKMLYDTKDFEGLYIQADYGQIHLNKTKIAEVMGEIA